MAKGQKPVILQDVSKTLHAETDEVFDFSDHFSTQMDASFIPGYAEQVKANEIAAVDDHAWYEQHNKTGTTKESQYKLIGCEGGRPLPVRFMWLRTMDAAGLQSADVAKELMEYSRRKYRKAVWPNDFEPYGYGFPPAGHLEADGTIRRDDVTLYVVDGRAADAFDKALRNHTQYLENSAPESVEQTTNLREKRTVTIED